MIYWVVKRSSHDPPRFRLQTQPCIETLIFVFWFAHKNTSQIHHTIENFSTADSFESLLGIYNFACIGAHSSCHSLSSCLLRWWLLKTEILCPIGQRQYWRSSKLSKQLMVWGNWPFEFGNTMMKKNLN